MTNTLRMFALFLLIFKVAAYFDLPRNEDANLKNCVARTIENVFGHEKTLMFATDVGGNVAFPDVIRNPYTIMILNSSLFKLWRAGYENVVMIIYDSNYNPTILYSNPYAIVNKCKQEVNDLIIGDCARTSKYQFENSRLEKYPYCNLAIEIPNLNLGHYVSRFYRLLSILESTRTYLNMSLINSTVTSHGGSTFQLHQNVINIYQSTKWAIVPYFQDEAVYIVPPPKIISPIIVLKNVFKPVLWFLIFTVFIGTSLVWWWFDKYYLKKSRSSAILNVYSITLLGSIDKAPLRPFLRLIFIVYVIYAIHIQTAFTSKLVTLLTIPQYEPYIQTLEDLAGSNLSIITNAPILSLVHETKYLNKLYSTIYNKFQAVPVSNLTEMLLRNNFNNCVFLEGDTFNSISFIFEHNYYYFKDNRFSSYFLYAFAFGYLKLTINEDADLKNCVARTIENVFGHEKTLMFVTDVGGNFVLPDVIRNPYAIINSKISSLGNVSSFISNDINLVIHYRQSMYFEANYMHIPKKVTLLVIVPFHRGNDIRNVFKNIWPAFENMVVIMYETDYKPTILYSDPYAEANKCKQAVSDFTISNCTCERKYEFQKYRLGKYPYCSVLINLSDTLLKNQKYLCRISRLGSILKSTANYLNISLISTAVAISHVSAFRLEQNRIDCFLSKKYAVIPYFQDDGVYIVPSPKIISPMIVLKNVFKPVVWILIFVFVGCTSFVWWLFDKYYKNKSSAIINVYSITLLGSIDKVPLQSSLRLIFIAYVTYSIHIQTAFTSTLIQLLTVPQYEPHIKTLENLADSNLSIITTSHLYDSIRNTENLNTLYLKIFNKFHVIPDSDIRKILDSNFDRNCIFFNSDLFNGFSLFSENKFYYFKDNRFSSYFQYVFASNQHSNFFNSFNNLVQILFETGDADRTVKQFEEQTRLYHRYRKKNYLNQFVEDKVVITLKHLCSPFLIWGLGLFSAFVVFIFEVNYTRNS
ncbi:hypothetical protein FQR65_LT00169 [Abscondita terminalis]|nr:hypothetical protein FQR65_LT00169 [Abscondita terminalis]